MPADAPGATGPTGGAGQAGGGRRVARNSILQAGADAVGKVGMVVLYAIMAREAGVAAFGDFTTAAALSILIMVAAFGMDFRVMRFVATDDGDLPEAFWCALAVKLVLGLAMLVGLSSLAFLGPYSDRTALTTVFLGLAILVELLTLTPQAIFRGRQDLAPVGVALVLYRGTLSSAGIAVLLAGGTIVAIAGLWLACSVLGLAYTLLRLRGAGVELPMRVSRAGMRRVGLDSIGLGLSALLGATLSRLDIVLLGLLKDTHTVALYGGAYRLMESTQFLTNAVALASFPALARLSRTSIPTLGDATALVVKVLLVVTLPIAIVFGICAHPVLVGAYGGGFGAADGALLLLAPTVVTAGIYGLLSFALAAQNAQRPIVLALLWSTGVNVVANLALVPPFGAEGAAAAWCATTVVLSVLLLRSTLALTGRLPLVRTGAAPVAAAAAMAAVTGAGEVTGPRVALAVFVFALVLVIVEMRWFPQDVRRLRATLLRGR